MEKTPPAADEIDLPDLRSELLIMPNVRAMRSGKSRQPPTHSTLDRPLCPVQRLHLALRHVRTRLELSPFRTLPVAQAGIQASAPAPFYREAIQKGEKNLGGRPSLYPRSELDCGKRRRQKNP